MNSVSVNSEPLLDPAASGPAMAAPPRRSAYLAWNRITMFLAFGGIFVAGFLSLSHILNVTIPCGPSHGCDIVDRSPLSKWFGLPVAYYGLVSYLALAALSIVRLAPDLDLRRAAIRFGLFISGIGSLVSFYLIYTALVEIHATCYWCLASATIMCLLFLSHAFLSQAEDTASGSVASEKWFLGAAVALCVFGLSSRVWNLQDIANNAVTKIDWSQDYKTIEDLIPKDQPHIKGTDKAPVVIIEFADLTCPHCKASYLDMRQTLLQSHGNVKFVFRHYPLFKMEGHEMALSAAVLSEIAGEKDKFWEFVDLVFSVEDLTKLTGGDLLTMAQQVGLNPEEVKKRLQDENDPAYKRVQRDMDADKTIGLRGTPTFFMGLKGGKPQVETATTFQKVLLGPPYNRYVVLGHGKE